MKANPFFRPALFVAVLACGSSAQAGTYYWDPDGTGILGFGTASGTWGTDAFWNTDSTGSSGGTIANTTITTADDINFGTASAGLAAGTITGPATAQGFLNMTFGSASGAIVLSGGTLNLDTSTGSTITVNNSSDTISTVLQGSGGKLIKAGSGTLTLSGNNTYTGSTTISAGTLKVQGPLQSSSAFDVSGTLDLAATNVFTSGHRAALNAPITINAGGTVINSNNSVNRIGNINLNGGTLTATYNESNYGSYFIGGVSSGDPTVTVGGSVASTINATNNGNIKMWSNVNFDVADVTGNANGDLTVSAALGNQTADQGGAAASLTKLGAGTMVLTVANNYTGTTTISAGTLQIGNAGATGSLYSPSISSGNLTFGSTGAITNNGALVYNISGGAVHVNKTISGTGTVSVTGNQGVNFANGTSISSSGSQTYSATATSGRYNGFNLTDNGTVTLTSTAGNISMTGMLGTANGNTGNLTLNTSAGNGNVTLNTPAGISGVDYGLNSLTVTAGTGTISLGTFNSQNWNTINTISLTGGSINSTANMTAFTNLNVTNSGTSAFSGALSGGGALNKSGSGTLTLTNANTYSGATAVSEGTLKLQNSNASSGFSISSGAVLELNVASGSRDGAGTTFSGAGTLRKTGAGTSIWGAGAATFSLGSGSLIDVQEGRLTGGSNANEVWTNNKSDLNVASGANFSTVEANVRVNKITGTGTIGTGYNGAGYANLTIGVDNGSSTFGGVIQNTDNNSSFVGNLVKAGSGTITLTGNNTYKGTTTVSGGTLEFSGTNSIGAVTANGGNVSFTGGTTAITGNLSQTMDGGNAISITNSTVTMNQLYSSANDMTSLGMAFTIGAGADVTATGGVVSQTWRGSGGMFLNGGTLRTSYLAANSSTTSFLNDRAYIHFNGTKIVATANESNFIQLVGGANYGNENFAKLESTTTFDTAGFGIGIGVELRGTGGLTKDGGGTLTLSGANTYTGATNVTAGTLVINGNISTSSLTTVKTGATLGGSGTVGALTVDSGAFVTPGNSPGILNTGNYNQAGTLSLELNGTTAGTTYDQVNVTGTVTLSGALTATVGYTPVNGQLLFILLNDGTDAISGTFSGLAQGATVTFNGFDWQISYNADSTANTFTGTPNGNDIALMAVPEPNVAALFGGLGMLALLRRRR